MKDWFNTAMDKIKASDELKAKILESVMTDEHPESGSDADRIRTDADGARTGTGARTKTRKTAAVAAGVLVLAVSAVFLKTALKAPATAPEAPEAALEAPVTDEPDEGAGITVMRATSESEYIAVLYLDGYAYMGGEAWYWYSVNEDSKISEERKGGKIGEVTLDLKGLRYTGVPPDFSSTFDVGTEVYEVKGLKREYAVLLVSGENSHILYRSWKATANEDDPIGLTVNDVFRMISDSAVISSVELRNETDSSWMRTSYDDRLLELLNTEIREKLS